MESMTLSSGSRLQGGKYRIVRVLGQGGFGITYEAEQVSLGRRVAVKEFFMKDVCNRDGSTSHVSVPSVGSRELVEKFRQKFLREARMIAGLDHEHIVRVFDVFEENGTAYYVMEYLPGGSLADGVKRGEAMPEDKAIGYVRQVADALQYLHSQNILHFDVKPSNVLLGKNGSAKLIDFGISKHYDESGSQTSSTPIGISKGFAPLEQYQQGSDIQTFTPATDIYALGATLYALLAGSNPPEASIVNEDGVPSIEGIRSKTMHAIEKAMQPRRKDRPQSVGEFLNLLDGNAEDEEDTVLSGPKYNEKKVEEHQQNPVQNTGKPQNAKDTKDTKVPELFPKWIIGAVAGVAVAVAAVLLWPKMERQGDEDNQQADSTAVVAEAVLQEPVTSQSSASASKPETPTVIELKSISLSKTTLELEESQSATLTVKYNPSNATDKTTTWKTTDASIAKVSTSGKVTAVKAGSAAIIASCQGKDAYCNVTVKAKEVQPSKPEQSAQQTTSSTSSVSQTAQQASATTGTNNGHEWVDLGLSVKWATCNVGASNPEGYGSYFAWGETSPKSDYSWSSLKYCNDTSGDSFSKYNQNQGGTKDNKTTLELSDDAARANWGGSWRMPTINEFQELIDKCTWTWTTMNGKNGYKVVSKSNGNSIFLPAAGWRYDTSLSSAGSYGSYWSSSLYESRSCIARGLYLYSDSHGAGDGGRRSGQSVRPVFR